MLLQFLNWDKNSLHVSPWWGKASCSVGHLINVFDCKAMPLFVSESGDRKGTNLRHQSPMQSFSDSQINKTPHPNRPHREANDYNSFLKLSFTTMTNHNLFYDIKVKIWSAKLSCMWWKKLLKRSLRKIRVSTPFKRWYIYIILSILKARF